MGKKAVVLLSGGLDSTLAARWLLQEDIEVHGISFITGFCPASWKNRLDNIPHVSAARKSAEALGISFMEKDIREKMKKIVISPRFGYGKNMNPCVDCRILMLREAADYMREINADFVATGEVLDQRPMSQRYPRLRSLSRYSGLGGRLLRPLSARCLPPSLPEKEGWVKRENLGNIQGRTRKHQIAAMKKWNLTEGVDSGGISCSLTDPNYAVKLKNYLEAEKKSITGDNSIVLDNSLLSLFYIGRHFKLRSGMMVSIGRNREDNDNMEKIKAGKILIMVENLPAPSGLLYWNSPRNDPSTPDLGEEDSASRFVQENYVADYNSWLRDNPNMEKSLPDGVDPMDVFITSALVVSYSLRLGNKDIPFRMEIPRENPKTDEMTYKMDRVFAHETLSRFQLVNSQTK